MPLPTVMHNDVAVARVLVADDRPHVLDALSLLLEGAGFEPACAASAQAVRQQLATGACDLLLLDLNDACDAGQGREGLELIADVRERYPMLPIVVITGCGSTELAVEAMRRGARTFVRTPWDNDVLIGAIAREIGEGVASPRAGARASRELDDARTMQRALLPDALPSMRGCDVAALWRPAGAIGGDCYDAIRLSDTRLALSIGDVAGKGLPAALLMAHVLATTRAYAAVEPRPKDLVARVNRALCLNAALATFVTSCHAIVDLETRTIAFTNAGHAPPILVRADGSAVRLAAGGPVLGVIPDADYEQEELPLRSGDRLLFYTDGVTEARSADGAEFGEARLLDLVASVRHAPAQRLIAAVFAGVCEFSRSLDDDVALMAVAID